MPNCNSVSNVSYTKGLVSERDRRDWEKPQRELSVDLLSSSTGTERGGNTNFHCSDF